MEARAARQFGIARPDLKLCGARTRAGGECANQPVRGRSRCRMHGGTTARGFAHPNYKHGWYSTDIFNRVRLAMVRDYRRREKFRRKIERQLAAENAAREAKEARAAARRPKWNIEALRALCNLGGATEQA